MGTLGPAPPYLFLLFPELYHFSSLVLAVLTLAFALALARSLSLACSLVLVPPTPSSIFLLCTPGWPGTLSTDHSGLELSEIFLPLSPNH